MKTLKRIRGFTFLELMMVISLIMILYSITMPVSQSMRERAQAARTHSTINRLELALSAYEHYWGFYPPDENTNLNDPTAYKTLFEYLCVSFIPGGSGGMWGGGNGNGQGDDNDDQGEDEDQNNDDQGEDDQGGAYNGDENDNDEDGYGNTYRHRYRYRCRNCHRYRNGGCHCEGSDYDIIYLPGETFGRGPAPSFYEPKYWEVGDSGGRIVIVDAWKQPFHVRTCNPAPLLHNRRAVDIYSAGKDGILQVNNIDDDGDGQVDELDEIGDDCTNWT